MMYSRSTLEAPQTIPRVHAPHCGENTNPHPEARVCGGSRKPKTKMRRDCSGSTVSSNKTH